MPTIIQPNRFWNFIRYLLFPLALLYGLVVWLRGWLYRSKLLTSAKFSLPVIAVGNLSTGGTGKTPHIEYLIELLQYHYRIATMSRGYKRYTQGFILADSTATAYTIGDEPMQFALKYPEVHVSVAEDRLIGIPQLIGKVPDTDILLLDDTYQHLSILPGMNILITDFAKPYYKDYILPLGNLREFSNAAQRAHIIIVSKCPKDISQEVAAEVRQKLKPLPNQHVFFTTIGYFTPYELFSNLPYNIANQPILLVTGIATPDTLVKHITTFTKDLFTLHYPDHNYFTTADIANIKSNADYYRKTNPNLIIATTEKDAVRLLLHRSLIEQWEIPLIVLPIKVNFLFDGELIFNQLILDYVEKTIIENIQN